MLASADHPVVVIGAGPHGLAAVAHLRDAGVPTVAFGEPLSFWRETMPSGMLLRSASWATNISSPRGELSLTPWSQERGFEIVGNLSLGEFIDYGDWFRAHAVPDLDMRSVASVSRGDNGFTLTLADGAQLEPSRVVVAAGIRPFARVPSAFRDLLGSGVSHTSASPPMREFAGKSVAVIGSGQSALEGAALVVEAGAAEVQVVARARRIYWLNHGWMGDDSQPPLPAPSRPSAGAPSWRSRRGLYWHNAPTDVGGPLSSWLGAAPDLVRRLPRSLRARLTYRCIRPAGADWLPDRLRDVNFTLGRAVLQTQADDGRVRLRLDDGSERLVDHVLLGTGYSIDLSRYPFLSPQLVSQVRVAGGSPLLARGLESSVPGLHFVGAAAAESFGPTMCFVVGTAYTAPALTQSILNRRRPLFRWAF